MVEDAVIAAPCDVEALEARRLFEAVESLHTDGHEIYREVAKLLADGCGPEEMSIASDTLRRSARLQDGEVDIREFALACSLQLGSVETVGGRTFVFTHADVATFGYRYPPSFVVERGNASWHVTRPSLRLRVSESPDRDYPGPTVRFIEVDADRRVVIRRADRGPGSGVEIVLPTSRFECWDPREAQVVVGHSHRGQHYLSRGGERVAPLKSTVTLPAQFAFQNRWLSVDLEMRDRGNNELLGSATVQVSPTSYREDITRFHEAIPLHFEWTLESDRWASMGSLDGVCYRVHVVPCLVDTGDGVLREIEAIPASHVRVANNAACE